MFATMTPRQIEDSKMLIEIRLGESGTDR